MDLFRTEPVSAKSTYSGAEGHAGRAHSSAGTMEGAHLGLFKRGDAGEGTPDAVSTTCDPSYASYYLYIVRIKHEGCEKSEGYYYHHA